MEKPQPGRARIEVSVPAGKTGDVARVVALLADGRRVDLSLDSASGRYRGGLGLPPGRHAVRVRLYDRVHNWVELEEEIDVH